MSKQYLADNVGADGTVYPTVGEHIRNVKVETISSEAIAGGIQNNTDRAKVDDALDVTGAEFRTALVNMLTGKSAYFGGLDCDALTTAELAEIKAYLGIV